MPVAAEVIEGRPLLKLFFCDGCTGVPAQPACQEGGVVQC